MWEYDYTEHYGGLSYQVARAPKYGYDYFDGKYPLNTFDLYGDIDLNGSVLINDAEYLLKFIMGYEYFNHQQISNANVSMDTTISSLDAALIFRYAVGLIDSLPIDQQTYLPPASGDLFMDNHSFAPGELIEIPIFLIDPDGILSFRLEVEFDSTALNFQEVLWYDSNNLLVESNIKPGLLSFTGSSPNFFQNNLLLSTLKFIVNENFGDSETIISISKLKWNEEPLSSQLPLSILSSSLSTNKDFSFFEYKLSNNYPNPFNGETTLKYYLSKDSFVNIAIYDMLGNAVKNLVNMEIEKGYNTISWNATDDHGHLVSSGVYIYKIELNHQLIQTNKVIFLK